ncbi:TetR/AcrR family transcriptional regulator [Gordonia sp. CPCC 205333]|uniref:TetR/AcrR family transcriptional regulator n=1 Tax=Gordonia sp. CPCC 205333 TaxID=3140790 RepID=UPI003AF35DAA
MQDLGSTLPMSSECERADAARNRRLLLQAAATLIERHGAAGVTMDALAREAGVGKGTVFRRFGNRTGLMRALLNHSETELQQAFISGPPPLGPGAPPLDRLLAYGRARLQMHADHLDLLLEADESGVERFRHPVWAASSAHVTMLLRQLGFEDTTVLAVAIQAPFEAASVAHMTAGLGLDLLDVIAQWETMVRALVAGAIS